MRCGCRRQPVLQQQRSQAERFRTELALNRRLRRCSVVTLVEKQIQCTKNGGKPCSDIGSAREVEELLRFRQRRFGASKPLLRRARLLEESRGGFLDAESA